MARRITIEGKSQEDAVEEASRRLGRPVSEGEYQVLENRKGFWGMNRKVVLELEVPDDWVDPAGDAPVAEAALPVAAVSDEAPAPRRAASEPASGDEAEMVRTWIADIAQGIGLEATVEVRREGDRLVAEISGPDRGRLSANHGELLAAIQYLVGKVVARRFPGGPRIDVDAGGFRDKRARELEALAQKTADAVRKSGKRALLPPLPPAERRHVHMALAEDPDVATESEGDGFKKRVAVFPKSRAS